MTAQTPVWVISLLRAADRRQYVRGAFERVGLEIELLDAVDGSVLTPEQRRVYSNRRALFALGRGLTAGELAVAHSHVSAYRRMLDEGLPAVVVAEDDALPADDFPLLLAALDELPDNWDVVTFHSMFPAADPTPIDDRVLASRYRICRFRRVPKGTQCYLISAHAARRVLDVMFPIRLPIDEMLFRPHPAGLRVYGIEPNPVSEHAFASELARRRAALGETGGPGTRLVDGAIVVAGKVTFRVRRRIHQLRATRGRAS